MKCLSGEKMEQVIVGTVSVVVVVCATFLGYVGKLDAGNVLTGVITGVFGYAGMANRKAEVNVDSIEVKEQKQNDE